MSRTCQITGAKRSKGHYIRRSGKAKKKGGIGMHVTANTPRNFLPNVKKQRIQVLDGNRVRTVRVKLTRRALKTISKKGARAVLKKAGVI